MLRTHRQGSHCLIRLSNSPDKAFWSWRTGDLKIQKYVKQEKAEFPRFPLGGKLLAHPVSGQCSVKHQQTQRWVSVPTCVGNLLEYAFLPISRSDLTAQATPLRTEMHNLRSCWIHRMQSDLCPWAWTTPAPYEECWEMFKIVHETYSLHSWTLHFAVTDAFKSLTIFWINYDVKNVKKSKLQVFILQLFLLM